MVAISLLLVIGMLLAFAGYQMRVIDRLTNKLMAKDYREYKQLDKPVKEEPEVPKHKPKSWADDVQYEDEPDESQ
jgi:hypothetical protein